MKLQISFEILISLSLAFAFVLYATWLWSGMAPKLGSVQQSAASYLANSSILTHNIEAQISCFESNQVLT